MVNWHLNVPAACINPEHVELQIIKTSQKKIGKASTRWTQINVPVLQFGWSTSTPTMLNSELPIGQ
jgi:hypothetical protein